MLIQIYINEIINYIFKENSNLIQNLLNNFFKTIQSVLNFKLNEDKNNLTFCDNKFITDFDLNYFKNMKYENFNQKEYDNLNSTILFFKELFNLLKDNFLNKKFVLEILIKDYSLLECILLILKYNIIINPLYIKLNLKNMNYDNCDYEEFKNSKIYILLNDLYYFGIEILIQFMNGIPNFFKNYLLKFIKDNVNILELFINIICYDKKFGVKYEIGELLKFIFETHNINYDESKLDKLNIENCIDLFFKYFIISSNLHEYCENDKKNITDSKQVIIDIFNFLMQVDFDIMTNFINKKNLIKIFNNLLINDKIYTLNCLKFIKTLMMNGNEYIINILLNEINIFDELLNLLENIIHNPKDHLKYNKEINNLKYKNFHLNILGTCILDIFFNIKNCNFSLIIAEHLKKLKIKLNSLLPHTELIIKIIDDTINNNSMIRNFDFFKPHIKDETSFSDRKNFEDEFINKNFFIDNNKKEKNESCLNLNELHEANENEINIYSTSFNYSLLKDYYKVNKDNFDSNKNNFKNYEEDNKIIKIHHEEDNKISTNEKINFPLPKQQKIYKRLLLGNKRGKFLKQNKKQLKSINNNQTSSNPTKAFKIIQSYNDDNYIQFDNFTDKETFE